MEIKGSLENALSEIDALRAKMSELASRKDIHQIELDLLLQKLRDLYDFMRSLPTNEELVHFSKLESDRINKPPRNQDRPKTIGFVPDRSVAEAEHNEAVREESSAKESIKSPVEEKKVSHEEAEKSKPGIEPKAEKKEESKKSVHELLSETVNKTSRHIGSALLSKPLNNIEDAIGLNDKFQFIRELFGSDSTLYKDTIEFLDNAGDFNSAYSFIEKNFNWDPENETVQKMLELIRRRHIEN